MENDKKSAPAGSEQEQTNAEKQRRMLYIMQPDSSSEIENYPKRTFIEYIGYTILLLSATAFALSVVKLCLCLIPELK